jgi:hypothetical protein
MKWKHKLIYLENVVFPYLQQKREEHLLNINYMTIPQLFGVFRRLIKNEKISMVGNRNFWNKI